MNTVLFMLDKWNGKNVGKKQMNSVPLKEDFIDIYGKGYIVISRMYQCELNCWILIVNNTGNNQ